MNRFFPFLVSILLLSCGPAELPVSRPSVPPPTESPELPDENEVCIPAGKAKEVIRSTDLADEVLFIPKNENFESWYECERSYKNELDEGADLTLATYGNVLCHAKLHTAARLSNRETRPPTTTTLMPLEIAPTKRREMAAYQRFIFLVNENENLANIKYRLAHAYYEHNFFEEAAVLFHDIVEKHPEEEIAVYAAELYIDSLGALQLFHKAASASCGRDLVAFGRYLSNNRKAILNELNETSPFTARAPASAATPPRENEIDNEPASPHPTAMPASGSEDVVSVRLLKGKPFSVSECGRMTLESFSHKRPSRGGPTKATAYIRIDKGALSDSLSLSVHGTEGKSTPLRYDSLIWRRCTFELTGFVYDESITVKVTR